MYKILRNISFRRRGYKPLVKTSGIFEPTVLPHETAEAEEEETPELLARREALWSQIRRDSEARARGEPVR